MKPSRIKAKFREQQPAMLVSLHLTDQSMFELVGLMGFDGIWMDMEHHFYNLETGAGLMRAFRVYGGDIVARCANREFTRMARMLEAGANGIMYPRCADAAEATEVVKWVKFPPIGERGIDGGNPDMPYCTMDVGEYIRQANDETFVVAQVEDPQAVENAEAIGAVDGIDVLMLGPGDFTVQSGIPGQFDHPKFQNAVEKVARAARNTGKNWGMPMNTADAVKQGLSMGARFIPHQSDLVILKETFEKIQKEFEPMGFTYENRIAART